MLAAYSASSSALGHWGTHRWREAGGRAAAATSTPLIAITASTVPRWRYDTAENSEAPG